MTAKHAAPERTYARFDATSAATHLDSLGLPRAARRMLLDVFARSFFSAESEMHPDVTRATFPTMAARL